MLRDFRLDDLKGLNVFIGPNATGKSAVHDAMRLLLVQPSQFNLTRDHAYRGAPGSKLGIEVNLELGEDDVRSLLDALAVSQSKSSPPAFVVEDYSRLLTANVISFGCRGFPPRVPDAGAITVVKSVQPGQPSTSFVEVLQKLSEKTRAWEREFWGFDPPRLIQNGLLQVVSDQVVALPTARGFRARFGVGRVAKPDPQGIGPWLHQSMVEKRPEFGDYERQLSNLLPHTTGIRMTPSVSELRIGTVEDGLPEMTPAENWSSGTVHLSLFSALPSLPKGSVVLAEEPELSLHPAAIRRLMRMIHRLADSRSLQFFLTTHSDKVVEGIDPRQKDHSLWQFSRNPDGSTQATRCETEGQIAEAIDSLVRPEEPPPSSQP